MTKIAKLVTVSLMVRVVVDENATDEQIVEAAMPGLNATLNQAGLDNLEEIKDDTECPFGTFEKDKTA